jgi:hypothetical protein
MWRLSRGFDLVWHPEEYAAIPMIPALRAQIDSYVYLDNKLGLYVLCTDDARFYNHSDDPNTGPGASNDFDIAYRDIEVGEEILCDYTRFAVGGCSGFLE